MKIIKRITFQLLLGFRRLILGLSKLLAIVFLIGTLGIFFLQEFHNAPIIAKIMTPTFTIICTFINWFYDDLIFYFKPDDMELFLQR